MLDISRAIFLRFPPQQGIDKTSTSDKISTSVLLFPSLGTWHFITQHRALLPRTLTISRIAPHALLFNLWGSVAVYATASFAAVFFTAFRDPNPCAIQISSSTESCSRIADHMSLPAVSALCSALCSLTNLVQHFSRTPSLLHSPAGNRTTLEKLQAAFWRMNNQAMWS